MKPLNALSVASTAARSDRSGGEIPTHNSTITPDSSQDRDDDTITLDGAESPMDIDEHSPLLGESRPDHFGPTVKSPKWRAIPKRITSAVVGTIRVVVTTIATPVIYVIACFYDEEDRFSPFLPIITICKVLSPRRRKVTVPLSEKNQSGHNMRNNNGSKRPTKRPRRPPSIASSTAIATDSELDEKMTPTTEDDAHNTRSTRSRSSVSSSGEEITPARRSIRIKLHNEDVLNRRRQQQEDDSKDEAKAVVAAALKSPSSPGGAKLKFPKAPAPPRPLIPRRQPSYTNASNYGPHAKTLIIDLDETLIHSHSKGGRFATGHMVEVKMHTAVGVGGTFLGPQIPILYYVHKRPHCDEFLRKVSKWYNLVIFTASVQEYADPVIDWLELERKYFSGRLYRQHCTQRNGAYVKDLSTVEADLSRVMILDNSPVSYVFHEDNAIPIEGWISDPTDNDLLNLIPLLEGLQHTTDVRALLALRLGQPDTGA